MARVGFVASFLLLAVLTAAGLPITSAQAGPAQEVAAKAGESLYAKFMNRAEPIIKRVMHWAAEPARHVAHHLTVQEVESLLRGLTSAKKVAVAPSGDSIKKILSCALLAHKLDEKRAALTSESVFLAQPDLKHKMVTYIATLDNHQQHKDEFAQALKGFHATCDTVLAQALHHRHRP